MKRRVLLSGFEPFDGFKVNPSAVVAEILDDTVVGNAEVHGYVLPLDYVNALTIMHEAVEFVQPTHIISCGQSYSPEIRLERLAINAINTERPDNYGFTPESDIIMEDGPVGYFGTIDPHSLVARLKADNINAIVSYHAGTFGCNWLYYNLLHWAANDIINARVLFVHLPPLPCQADEKKRDIPSLDQDTQITALKLIIESL